MAQPFWVNLLIVVPFVSYFFWRNNSFSVSWTRLISCAIFAASFGVVEATVVIYLRAVLAAAGGYGVSLTEVTRFSQALNYATLQPAVLPSGLLGVEICREAATIFMLVTVSFLAGTNRHERWAIFLWVFAIWDLAYYATLWATIKWPSSLTETDVLFLIPVPWISQVWFPILVSTLCAAAVLVARRRS